MYLYQGVNLDGSLGNNDDFLQSYNPKNNITTLSKPAPNPPCGNAPNENDST